MILYNTLHLAQGIYFIKYNNDFNKVYEQQLTADGNKEPNESQSLFHVTCPYERIYTHTCIILGCLVHILI